jgi:hypothetical protein
MNCFLLPKSWCSDVDGLIAKYWWGQTKNERKIHSLKWDKLCRRKFEGGLGFKNLHLFNLALLAKQRWWLLQAPQSLYCRIFKAKYFPTCSFLDATLGPNPSYIWRSILVGRKVLVNRVIWKPSVTGTTRAIWNFTPSGTYSMQSGYTCLEVDLRTLVEGESSCSQSRRRVWRKFWKL